MTSAALLDQTARQILRDNDRGGYTVPTKGLYPFQWNWDSMFVALGFQTFDEDRAWQEVETLFDAQWDCGFVPHIVFHVNDPGYYPGPDVWQAGNGRVDSSGITQPPVAASIVRWMLENSDDDNSRFRVRDLLPKINTWHRWFREVRDPEGNGLVMIVHPWESGRDNSAEWIEPFAAFEPRDGIVLARRDTGQVDASQRPHDEEYLKYITLVEEGRDLKWDHAAIARTTSFRVACVGMTMILLRAERDLLALAREFGDTALAEEVSARLEIAETGVPSLWNEEAGAYCSRDYLTGKSSGLVTNASFLAPYAGVVEEGRHQRLMENMDRIQGACGYLVPSLDPASEFFDAPRYWLGPVWAVVNYMIGRGLLENGDAERSSAVRADLAKLMAKSGFAEAFDCQTGKGSGGAHFTWTAAIWLHWKLSELAGE